MGIKDFFMEDSGETVVKGQKNKEIKQDPKEKDSSTAIIIGFITGQLLWWLVLDKILKSLANALSVGYPILIRIIVSIVFSIIIVGGIGSTLTKQRAMKNLAYKK
ncbi:MAG: hypothetical protein KKH88_04495 [Nanoarchaeota archaeon]|nr:hypothetical protein [Nanoarchaeota archaeon]